MNQTEARVSHGVLKTNSPPHRRCWRFCWRLSPRIQRLFTVAVAPYNTVLANWTVSVSLFLEDRKLGIAVGRQRKSYEFFGISK